MDYSSYQHLLFERKGDGILLITINRLIVRCAEDIVFYRDDLAWVRRFIEKNRHYRIEPTISKQPTRTGSLLISRLKVASIASPHEAPA